MYHGEFVIIEKASESDTGKADDGEAVEEKQEKREECRLKHNPFKNMSGASWRWLTAGNANHVFPSGPEVFTGMADTSRAPLLGVFLRRSYITYV